MAERVVAAEPVPEDVTAVRRHAVVFVPGMGDRWIDQSVAGVGARIAEALNQQALESLARVTVDPEVREEGFGQGRHTSACTIIRVDDGAPTTAIDVYRLDGVRALRGDLGESSFIRKAALPALILWSYVPRAMKARKLRAKSIRERRKFNYALRDYLAFLGFRSHSIYWGRKHESEATVFRQVVEQMYAGDSVLA
jgi:hypothetical protein